MSAGSTGVHITQGGGEERDQAPTGQAPGTAGLAKDSTGETRDQEVDHVSLTSGEDAHRLLGGPTDACCSSRKEAFTARGRIVFSKTWTLNIKSIHPAYLHSRQSKTRCISHFTALSTDVLNDASWTLVGVLNCFPLCTCSSSRNVDTSRNQGDEAELKTLMKKQPAVA